MLLLNWNSFLAGNSNVDKRIQLLNKILLYSMRKKAFFDNLGAILAFALIGTIISTLVIALFAYGVAQFVTTTVDFNFLDMLLFGAIISATDPVTVLTIFHVSMWVRGAYF